MQLQRRRVNGIKLSHLLRQLMILHLAMQLEADGLIQLLTKNMFVWITLMEQRYGQEQQEQQELLEQNINMLKVWP